MTSPARLVTATLVLLGALMIGSTSPAAASTPHPPDLALLDALPQAFKNALAAAMSGCDDAKLSAVKDTGKGIPVLGPALGKLPDCSALANFF